MSCCIAQKKLHQSCTWYQSAGTPVLVSTTIQFEHYYTRTCRSKVVVSIVAHMQDMPHASVSQHTHVTPTHMQCQHTHRRGLHKLAVRVTAVVSWLSHSRELANLRYGECNNRHDTAEAAVKQSKQKKKEAKTKSQSSIAKLLTKLLTKHYKDIKSMDLKFDVPALKKDIQSKTSKILSKSFK